MSVINLGSLNIDHVYRVPHFSEGGETLTALSLEYFPGGKGLNQTVAAARSGAKTKHAGLIGPGGEFLLDVLRDAGADVSLVGKCDTPQGHAVIQVAPNGQNSIIVYGGSNREISEEMIDDIVGKCAPGDYFMLQNEISNLSYAVSAAFSRGLRVVLNASPVDEALLSADLRKVTWLLVNETECMALGGGDTPEGSALRLREMYPNTGIVLTLGKDGSKCYTKDGVFEQKAYPVEAVDTTAAGDTYAGYFTGCLDRGYSVPEAMRTASMASAVSVTGKGAAPSIPSMDRVMEFAASLQA